MAVTKQTYSANAGWAPSALADMFRDAFIDAGLMTAWHDSFTQSTTLFRVLKIEHDNTKTYGSSFYSFSFNTFNRVGFTLASGWNPSGTPPVNVPTGTQYLDYLALPANINAGNAGTNILSSISNTSNVFLDRYTSGSDNKQSWFVLRGLSGSSGIKSVPFAILHKNTALHSWLDLNKGMITGFAKAITRVQNRAGYVNFSITEFLRRCLLYGAAFRGAAFGFEDREFNTHCYFGVGNQNNSSSDNLFSGANTSNGAGVALPVGRSSANPAFVTDYVPICTELPWSPWTPTLLANDFGVYMHYADNTVAYGDRFIVQSGLNEWQVLDFANNANVLDGASATFLARIV